MDLHLHFFVKSLRPDEKCITATLGANQSNLLNIPVDTFAAKATSHGTLHSTIHGNNSQKPKVSVAQLNVRSLKTREHLIQVRNLMGENITKDLMRLAVGCAHTCTRP